MASDFPAHPRDAYFDVTHLGDDTARRQTRSSVFILGISVLKLFLNLFSTILLVRLIPPAEFGIASLAMPVAMIAVHISQFGLAQPIVQMPQVPHLLVSTLFWVNLCLGVACGMVLIAGSGLLARFYDVPEVGPVFAVLGLTVIVSAALTPYIAILRRRQMLGLLENAGLTAFVVSTLVAVVAALWGASYWAVILQQLLMSVITLALYIRGVDWRPASPRHIDLRAARGAIGFGASVSIGYLFQLIAQAVPTVFIGARLSPTAAGLYYRSVTLTRLLPERIVSPLASVFIPGLSRLQHDPAAFRKLFTQVTLFLNFLLIPISVLMFATADIFVPVLLGPEWAAATPLIAWLGLLIMLNPVDQTTVWALNAHAAQRYILVYGMVCLVSVGLAILGAIQISGMDDRGLSISIWIVASSFVIRLPVVAWFATLSTPLTWRVLLVSYLPDLAIGWAAIGAIGLGRQALQDSGPLAQFAFACLVLAAIYAVRLATTPVLRRAAVLLVARLRTRRGGAPQGRG